MAAVRGLRAMRRCCGCWYETFLLGYSSRLSMLPILFVVVSGSVWKCKHAGLVRDGYQKKQTKKRERGSIPVDLNTEIL